MPTTVCFLIIDYVSTIKSIKLFSFLLLLDATSTRVVASVWNRRVVKEAGTSVAGRQHCLSVSLRPTNRCSASVACAAPFFKDRPARLVLALVPSFSSVQRVTSSLIVVGVLSTRRPSEASDSVVEGHSTVHSMALVPLSTTAASSTGLT